MPKIPTAQPSPAKAVDVLTSITQEALAFRFGDKTVRLTDIGKLVIAASRVLNIRDADERISVENAAVIALAKKRNLLS
jgi:hypothetical protein